MKKEKRDEKMAEIKVLDSGKNMNDVNTPISLCCLAMLIPFRA